MAGSTAELPRGTVTFLFTDIERSTQLARQLGAEFSTLRSEHRRLLRESFERNGGHEIDTAGDGFFVAFERAGDAVTAAIAGQRALLELRHGEGTPLRVRMGLHSAEPYLGDEGYVGVGIHRAARICAAGHGGQILVSNATAGIVEDLNLEGVDLLDLGEHELKDIERPQRLFQLGADGLDADFPPLKTLNATRSGPSILTLLMTDVTGWHDVLKTFGDERATIVARAYQDLVLRTVSAEGGRGLEVIADTVITAFERPRDALRAALAVRNVLRTEPWFPDENRPAVRMAIHSGRIADSTSRHLGSVAFRVSALCASAEPWQILVSHSTEALLEGDASDVNLSDLGERSLRSLERPVHVFAIQE